MMCFFLNFFIVNAVFIQPLWTLQCFTCASRETGFLCTLPLAFDNGDESNENEVNSQGYDADFYCESDHSFNPRTGEERIILRGNRFCEEVDIPNHRRACCRTDYCNKHLPDMITEGLPKDEQETIRYDTSHHEHMYPSLSLIFISIIIRRWITSI